MSADSFRVGIYRESLAWGGPEEGGWWYDVGSLEREIGPLFGNEDAAWDYAARVEQRLNYFVNRHLPPKHSVSSDGVLVAMVFNCDQLPEGYPESCPHYE